MPSKCSLQTKSEITSIIESEINRVENQLKKTTSSKEIEALNNTLASLSRTKDNVYKGNFEEVSKSILIDKKQTNNDFKKDIIESINSRNPKTKDGKDIKVIDRVVSNAGREILKIEDPSTGKKSNIQEKNVLFDNTVIKNSDRTPDLMPGRDANDEFVVKEEINISNFEDLDYSMLLFQDFDTQFGNNLDESKDMEFIDYSNNILKKLYVGIAETLDFDTVSVNVFQNDLKRTAGVADIANNNISIRISSKDKISSSREIVIHELSHIVAAKVFEENVNLRKEMDNLRKTAVDAGADYKIFLKGIENPNGDDVAVAKSKYERVFSEVARPEEFYAYAISNVNVFNFVKDLNISDKYIGIGDGANPVKGFAKIFNSVSRELNSIASKNDKGSEILGTAAVGVILNNAQENAAERQSEDEIKEGKVSSVYNKLDDQLSGILERKTELIDKLSDKTSKPINKIVEKLKETRIIGDLIKSGAMQYVYNTITKDTSKKDNAGMYKIFRKAKNFIETHTSDIRSAIKRSLFGILDGVDEGTKGALKKIFVDVDLRAIDGSISDKIKVLTDNKFRKDEIKRLEELCRNYGVNDISQIHGLAHYMLTGSTIHNNQMINAHNIYMLNHKSKNEDAIKAIDKLVTLVAIENAPEEDISLALKYMKENPKDSKKIIDTYNGYMNELSKDTTIDKYDPNPKGYSRPQDGDKSYELIPYSEIEDALAVNMKLIGDGKEYNLWKRSKNASVKDRVKGIEPAVVIGGVKYYKMVGRVKSLGFDEGAIGIIGSTMEGISLSSLIRKNQELKGTLDLTGGFQKNVNQYLAHFSTNGSGGLINIDKNLGMVPIYDSNMKIVDYRIQLNKLDKLTYLDQVNEFEDVLSNTFSRSTKTELTKKFNKVVVDTIFEHTAKGITGNPGDYVTISEYTDEMKKNKVPRTEEHDRWDRLPAFTKEYIYVKNGGNKALTIHKDFVEMMTGEKAVTMANSTILGRSIFKNPVAKARVMALESYIKELLGYMKRSMILLDSSIVIGNIVSNSVVASIHGIDPITYFKEMKKNWKLLDEYSSLKAVKADLEVRKKAGENVDSKIQQINEQINEHTYHPLVQDGQFSVLSEDLNTSKNTEGQLFSKLREVAEEKLDKAYKNRPEDKKERVKNNLNTIFNYLYINKESKVGKFALENAQKQDAMTRKVIMDHLLKKEAKKRKIRVQDLPTDVQDEILNYLDQLLVNYGYTMNRYVSYVEQVTGVLFLRYYFGQAKALVSLTTKKPLGVLSLFAGQETVGIDISDPFDTYSGSPVDALTNRFMLDDMPSQLAMPNVFDIFNIFK